VDLPPELLSRMRLGRKGLNEVASLSRACHQMVMLTRTRLHLCPHRLNDAESIARLTRCFESGLRLEEVTIEDSDTLHQLTHILSSRPFGENSVKTMTCYLTKQFWNGDVYSLAAITYPVWATLQCVYLVGDLHKHQVDLEHLVALPTLRKLSLDKCSRKGEFVDLGPLARIPSLRCLRLASIYPKNVISTLSSLMSLTNLTSLTLFGEYDLNNINLNMTSLTHLTRLTRLDVMDFNLRHNGMRDMSALTRLQELKLTRVVVDAELLASLTCLQNLVLHHVCLSTPPETVGDTRTPRVLQPVSHLGFLERLRHLQHLTLSQLMNVRDLSPLISLGSSLRHLELDWMFNLTNLEPLTALTNLTRLHIWPDSRYYGCMT